MNSQTGSPGGQDVAIIGMAGRFPGARDIDEFWRNLRSGTRSLRRLGDEELRAAGVSRRERAAPGYVPVSGVLEGAELFDAAFFGFTPREALVMNPQQRLFLECAWEALERAGYASREYAGRIGVYASEGQNRYMFDVLSQRALVQAVGGLQVVLSNSASVATLTSFKLGLEGPSLNVQTACSSSLVAVHLACQGLLCGETDVALAGGVRISVPQGRGYHYQPGGIASPTGECSPFDADARGTVAGSGVGAVVLKRLEDALADGDLVHAVIRGSAVNNDGDRKVGFTAPRWEGQAAVISEALAMARVEPGDVSYVEAHGTGTEVGDPIEVAALVAAFGEGKKGTCALGAVKSGIGHLDAAAGVVGLIKTVLALQNEEIPPSPYFRRPNPRIDFDRSPFYVNPDLRPWAPGGRPRIAGVSAFGIGGTNAHVVLEEAPQAAPSGPSRPWQLLVLSARTPAALEAATDRLAAHLREHPEQKLADVAHTLRVGRRRFKQRRVLVCRGREDAAAALEARDPRRVLEGAQEREGRPVAFLFPGVGDHYVQMARGLYEAEPVFRDEVDRCARVLGAHTRGDVREWLFPGDPAPEQAAGGAPVEAGGSTDLRGMLGRAAAGDPLGRTERAHPAVFVVEYALARLWMSWGVQPESMIGHSLGEYVAATVAGVFRLEDALALLAERARLISGLSAGAMLAVPMDPAALGPRLRDGLALAAHNAPGLCTVSGPAESVAALEAELVEEGVACRRLVAEHAFHSAEMEPVAERLAERLRAMRLAEPEIPFVSNVTGTWIRPEEATDPEYWTRHLCGTVRFAEGMRELLLDGSRVLLEVGPGRTLGTFALHGGAAEAAVFASLRHAYTRQSDQAYLLETLGRLWIAGVRMDWDGFTAGERRRRALLPTYPFERQPYWVERRPRRRGAPRPAASAAGSDSPGADPVPRAPAVTAPPAAAPGKLPGLQPRPETGTRYVAPAGELEERMAELWQDLLGFERIGAHDDFFSLGGHSLMATQLIMRVQGEFRADVSLDTVFEVPTVAGMAQRVATLRGGVDAAGPAAIRPVPRTGPLPLSYGQERIWVQDRLEPGNPMYNVPMSGWLRGPLDADTVKRALAEIVRRHEVYRTVYAEVDGVSVQIVRPHLDVPLPVDDFSGTPEADRVATVRRVHDEEARRPTDLTTGPVMRARLLRFEPGLHAFLVTAHHIVTDGWSEGLFLYELRVLYQAFAAGRPSPLPELPIQYADYAVWQREQLSGERLQQHLAFWRESLRGVPPTLELPTDRPRPPVQSFRGGKRGIELSAELVERVRALARRERTTFHLVLVAAFQALCFRYTGQEDFAMGSLAANRPRPETQLLLGFFLNTIPVRARPSARLRFDEVLGQVRTFIAGAYPHAELPLQMILDEVRPERDPSRNPLIQVMLGIQAPGDHGPPPEDSAGLSIHPLGGGAIFTGDSGTAKFDLTLQVTEGGALATTAVAEYNSDLFDPATVDRFLDHFRVLLEAAVDAPDTPLAQIPLLLEGERRQLLEEWNRTEAEYPSDRCLHHLFEAQAARTPDAAAVVFEEESLSYGALNARANRLAHHLRRLGVGREVRVGLCLERSLEMVVGLLGILKAGGAYVPLDPGYPAERLAYMLSDSGAPVLLTQEELRGALAVPEGTEVVDISGAERAGESVENPDGGATPDGLAYVIYTSGSTGRPKGVMNAHRGIVNRLAWMQAEYRLGAEDVVLQKTPFSFDVSVWEFFWPLQQGACLVMARPEGHRDPAYLQEVIERRGVTTLHFVPSMLQAFVEAADAERCATLKRVICSGEALPVALVERFHERFAAPVGLHNLYGPTEAAVDVSFWACEREGGRAAVPIGRPVWNTQLYVLDRGLGPVPVGVAGELYIGGVQVARGYLGRAELTGDRFVPDPFGGEAGGRLYRTGDKVRWRSDGALEYLGRLDEQVKVRGFRIEPGEVEAVLLAQPGVRECAVVVREDAPGERRLVAYLAAAAEGLPSVEELRARLRESLPEYMVPTAFVTLDALPLTPNGKVDRAALPTPAAERASGREPAAPRNPAERALVEIWSAVLGVERVGIHERFFELGGDSILAIRVATAARRAGMQLLPRQLFEHATIAELARVAGTGASLVAEQGRVTGAAPLTPIQRWFFAQEPPAPHHYNQALLLAPPRALEPRLLERALAALVEHHDALRLRFRRGGGGWTQEHAPAGERPPLVTIDLARLDGAARDRAMAEAADRVQAGLDLERGPVLRVAHFRARDEGRLLLALHHLVVDGVSWRILLEDLETAYVQAERGEPVRLPAKTTSWKAWAERLAEHAGAPETLAEAAYWTERARVAAAALPLDAPRAEDTAGLGRTVAVQLGADETEALLREVPAAYRTHVDEVLLCALVRALARWSGERRVRVELEGHGREEGRLEGVDLSRTVGWFTSLYPVLLELPAAGGPGEALRAVKEQLRAVPGRGLGYGLLRWMGGDVAVELAAAPRAEVAFNYLGQVDRTVSQDTFFRLAPESGGAHQDPRRVRPHRLEVNGIVSGGCLRITLGYGAATLREETARRLAAWYLEELRELVAHCRRTDAAGYTPSDFPRAGLDQAALDRLLGGERGIEDVYPATPMHEGMLFHSQYAPESGVYVGQLAFALEGPLDAGAVERAWRGAVARYAALRTGFAWRGLPRPLQVVRETVELEFRREDRPGLGAAELAELAAAERARGFDLERPPLMRVALLRVGDREHQLVWTYHHLLLDGWSLSVLFRDVLALYRAHARSETPQLSPPPRYGEYVAWLEARDAGAAERHWREELRGFAATTPLPLPRAGSGEARHEIHVAELSEALSRRLQERSRERGLTVNTLVQGAWALLLARYAGEDDVVFGATVSGRPVDLTGAEEMVGLFINTLPVRVPVPPQAEAGAWLARLQERQARAREHEHASLVQVRRWSELPPGEALFESLVVFENIPVDRAAADGAEALRVRLSLSVEQTNYPLTLVVTPGSRFHVALHYDGTRSGPDDAGRLVEQLGTLLEGLTGDPGRRLSEVSLLRDAERARLLAAWSAAAAGGTPLLHDLFAAQAARTPDSPAVVADGRVLTYAELERGADQLARRLQRRGVGPEVAVGVCMERSPELVLALLGILKAGGVYLPLDPAYPAERLAFMLADAGARALITGARSGDPVPAFSGERLVLDRDRTPVAPPAGGPPACAASRDNAAYVIYTSGSTGTPKGVVVTHASAVNLLQRSVETLDVRQGGRVLMTSSVSFDVSVLDVFAALLSGSALYFADREALLSPERLAALLRELESSTWMVTPALLDSLPDVELPALRTLVSGGDRCSARAAGRWSAGRRMVNIYGPTEATIFATSYTCPPGVAEAPPVGWPAADARVYVLDAWGGPVATGVPGELYIGGPGVARGYLGRPALTAERFLPDPFSAEPGARMYRTGDRLRRLASGALEFMGRLDAQVKIRGQRVEPGEVEAVLLGAEGVREAVVVAREDAVSGVPGEKRLVAYVVGDGGGDLQAGELRVHLRELLPEHMIPAAFVVLDRLPVTANGKVDRRALPEPGFAASGEYVAPRSATEELLCGIWADVLQVKRVGVHDGFFELGGHSLVANRLVSRVAEALGAELPIRVVFEAPTVAAMAERVDAARPRDELEAWEVGEELARLAELSDEEVARLAELSDEEVARLLAGGN